jgi:hypothetical protein
MSYFWRVSPNLMDYAENVLACISVPMRSSLLEFIQLILPSLLVLELLRVSNFSHNSISDERLDYQFLALGNASPTDNEGIEDLHTFWMHERKGLINFLLGKHKHLFEQQQAHITAEDIDRPCTLYVLLKTQPGVKAQQVFEETGVLGVDTPMKTGHYIRFAVGTLTEPTFSKYA